jgi:acyl carrier protein phosphodiesterase
MNYLAHLVLADDTPESLIGNLAGDFLQGMDRAALHPALLPGIARHRAVDAFTDAHAVVARSRARLGTHWRLWGRVLVDVFYDHFLAANFERHTGRDLPVFAARVYAALESHRHLLPPRLARAAPVMVRHDWLRAYMHVEGVGVILSRMAARTRHGANLGQAVIDLRREHDGLSRDFDEFFPQLRAALA